MRALAAIAAVLLTGCGTTTTLQTVKVAVPVECQERVPERPAMPTAALKPGVKLHDFVKAAQAEIERREGYEGKLLAALTACTRPIEDAPP